MSYPLDILAFFLMGPSTLYSIVTNVVLYIPLDCGISLFLISDL